MDLKEAIKRSKARDAAQQASASETEEHHPRPLRIHDCAESGCEPEPPPEPDAA